MAGHPERLRELAQLRLVWRGVARQREQGSPLRGNARESADQAREVLVRPLGRHAQHERPLPQSETGSRGARIAALPRRLAGALGHHVHELVTGAGEAQQVAARGRAGHDHPVSAADGQRHKHSHAKRAQPEMGLRLYPVVQVVNGHHPRKAAGGGARRREAVDQLDPSAPREPQGVKLVAGHPLRSPPRVDPRGGDRGELSPFGIGQPVHEQGQVNVIPPSERAHELARVDLQPAHLAGRQEQQVDPHVHGRPH